MESIIVCGYCGGMLKNPYGTSRECLACGRKGKKVGHITNIKAFIGNRNYYWLDCIKNELGEDFDKYIESYGKEGVIFTKSKYRGNSYARIRWIKRWSTRSIRKNDSIPAGTLESIIEAMPIGYEEAYTLLNKYKGGEDRAYTEITEGTGKSGIEFIDNNMLFGIKKMLNKYDAMARGDLDYDGHEQFILFALENPIDIESVHKIQLLKRINKTRYSSVVKIYEEYKKLPHG